MNLRNKISNTFSEVSCISNQLAMIPMKKGIYAFNDGNPDTSKMKTVISTLVGLSMATPFLLVGGICDYCAETFAD